MANKLDDALNKVEETYESIKQIADNIVEEHVKEIDNIVKYAQDNIENLTNEDLRTLMLKLSLKAYSFGDIEEKSAIKAECAEAIKKEKYSTIFTTTDGSNGMKDNIAMTQLSSEIVIQKTYELVAGLFKVKLDQIRRIVDTLKTVLMSRLSELKWSQDGLTENGDELK